MKFYRELDSTEKNRCVIVTYFIEADNNLGTLNDAVWALAIGQSVGNPKVRNIWETDDIFEHHSCVIYEEENFLTSVYSGEIKIGFPKINLDWDGDCISQLLCQIMGGQLDIDVVKKCRILNIEFPQDIKNLFLGPKYGISGIRNLLGVYNKPLSGAIIKPKIGMSTYVLGEMVKELLDGDVDFIKEDEIMSNPSICTLENRVEYISNIIEKSGKKVIYSYCINSDPHVILNRAKFVSENGGNSVHVNFWSGLGVYNSIRKMNLPLSIHFQKSGDKIFTNKNHEFGINWEVICELMGLVGVDTIHAGMYGGYLNQTEDELKNIMKILHENNTLPALSCGMHPGLIDSTCEKFGVDFIANCGGSIHGHPLGSIGGAKALRQAIDKKHSTEYNLAIMKWGKK